MAGKSGSILIRILGDDSSLARTLGTADAKVAGFSSRMKDAGQKMQDVGKKLTVGLTLPIGVAGVAAFKMAADFADASGATDTIFKSAAGSMQKWADKLPTYYGIAKGEALSYSNTMGSLLKNIGGKTDAEAAEMSQKLVGLAGDLSAMFGGSTDTAVQALTGALKGNTSMLDNYGIAANDALIKQKALTMGIWDGKGTMSLAAKQAATLNLIMEQTADAQGQAARESKGASGSMKGFMTQIKNLGIDLGTKLLPIGAKLIGWVSKVADWFSNLSPKTQNIILILGGLLAVLGPVVGAIGALSTAIGILASPITLIVIGVAALIAGLVLAYKKVDWFHNAVDAVGRWIRDTLWPILQDVGKWIAEKFVAAVKVLGDIWTTYLWPALQKVASFITGTVIPVITSIVTTFINVGKGVWNVVESIVSFIWNLPTRIRNIVSGMWDTLVIGFNVAKNWVVGLADNLVGFFTGLPGRIGSAVSGMWNGIKDAFRSALNWIIDKWNNFGFQFPTINVPLLGKIGGWHFDTPNIPRFHSGGVVGVNEGLAILQRGETVRTQQQEDRLQQILSGVAGQGVNVTINFSGPVAQDSAKWVADQVEQAVARGVQLPRLQRRMAS